MIDKVLKQSRAVDRESLCILSGRLVWNLSIEVIVLNEDGNLLDWCFLATMLALMNTRLPQVSYQSGCLRVDDSKAKPLGVHHLPICTTFYFVD